MLPELSAILAGFLGFMLGAGAEVLLLANPATRRRARRVARRAPWFAMGAGSVLDLSGQSSAPRGELTADAVAREVAGAWSEAAAVAHRTGRERRPKVSQRTAAWGDRVYYEVSH